MISFTGNQDVLCVSVYYFFSKAIAEANISNNLDIRDDVWLQTPTNFSIPYSRATDGVDLLKLSLNGIKELLIIAWYTSVVSELD